MPWTNSPLRLYHGTDLTSARSIKSGGIDLSRGSPHTDFGRGFYTTTHRGQAEAWARLVCRARPGSPKPALLVFDLDRGQLSAKPHLFFTHENDARTQFWEFVSYCRAGKEPHVPGSDNYAIVSGPVALWPQQFVVKDMDQVSFHNTARGAIDLPDSLRNSTVEELDLPPAASPPRRRRGRPSSSVSTFRTSYIPRVLNVIGRLSHAGHQWTAAALEERLMPGPGEIEESALTLTLHLDPRHLVCLLLDIDADEFAKLESGQATHRSRQRHLPKSSTEGASGGFEAD